MIENKNFENLECIICPRLFQYENLKVGDKFKTQNSNNKKFNGWRIVGKNVTALGIKFLLSDKHYEKANSK